MGGRYIEETQERSVDARIARLRQRLKGVKEVPQTDRPLLLAGVLLGLLDLLEAEL